MPKAATTKSGDPAKEKKRADGARARAQTEPPNLEEFRDDPVKGGGLILKWRSRDKIEAVLANADFATGLKKLASDATAAPKAAVVLSQFAMRPEFLSAAVAALGTSGPWPEPSDFKEAADRRRAADALERLRPSWGLSWLAKALVAASGRYPALSHFFASRLILAAGGLMGAAEALARRLLLDQKIVDLVTTLDAASGSKLREDAAKLAERGSPQPVNVNEPPRREAHVPLDQAGIMKEAAWSDADEALGRALRDMGFMARSFEQLESAVDGETAERARRAKGASDIVLQWVRQAARQRNIRLLNSVGERVQFDPVYHDLDDDASPGDYVRVVTPSIVRGDGAQQIVLLRGEVELD